MKIEITTEQFQHIQNEIIRLEDEKQANFDKLDGWDFIYYNDRIALYKQILETETIDLSLLNS